MLKSNVIVSSEQRLFFFLQIHTLLLYQYFLSEIQSITEQFKTYVTAPTLPSWQPQPSMKLYRTVHLPMYLSVSTVRGVLTDNCFSSISDTLTYVHTDGIALFCLQHQQVKLNKAASSSTTALLNRKEKPTLPAVAYSNLSLKNGNIYHNTLHIL